MIKEKQEKEQLVNPFTGKAADESITEKEAKERGYIDLQFILRHLEDENENYQWFRIKDRDIVVKRVRPHLNYKKPTQINHERVIRGSEEERRETTTDKLPLVAPACNINNDSEPCISCGS